METTIRRRIYIGSSLEGRAEPRYLLTNHTKWKEAGASDSADIAQHRLDINL